MLPIHFSKYSRFFLHFWFSSVAVLLLVCVFVEMFYFNSCYEITVSEECEVQNSQSRFYTRYLPRFYDTVPPPYSSLVDTAPPPYSSLKSSSASTQVLPTATSFTNVQGCPIGAEFSPEDPPPPYEYQGCSGNTPYSSKNYEEHQQYINLCFSAHV